MASPLRIVSYKRNPSHLMCSGLPKYRHRTLTITIPQKYQARPFSISISSTKFLPNLKTYENFTSNNCLLRFKSSSSEILNLDKFNLGSAKSKQWDEELVIYSHENTKDIVYMHWFGVLLIGVVLHGIWFFLLGKTPEEILALEENQVMETIKMTLVTKKEWFAAGAVVVICCLQAYQLRHLLWLVRRISLLADGQTVRISTNSLLGNLRHTDHHISTVYMPYPEQLSEHVNKKVFVKDSRLAYLVEARADSFRTALLDTTLGTVKPGIPEQPYHDDFSKHA